MPLGRARPVSGGFEITGRWGFGSGVRHTDWVLTAAVIDDGSILPAPVATGAAPASPSFIFFVVPTDRVQIEDTWRTHMLSGTGSHHYRLENVFVEEDFTCPYPLPLRQRALDVRDILAHASRPRS